MSDFDDAISVLTDKCNECKGVEGKCAECKELEVVTHSLFKEVGAANVLMVIKDLIANVFDRFEKRIEFLEASNKSFASTFWDLEESFKCLAENLQAAGKDFRRAGSALSVKKIALSAEAMEMTAKKLEQAGSKITATLEKLDRDWLGDGDEQI